MDGENVKLGQSGIVFKFKQNAVTIQELLDKIQELPNSEALSGALFEKLDKEYTVLKEYTPYEGEAPIEWLPYYLLRLASKVIMVLKKTEVYGNMMSEPIFLTPGSSIRIKPETEGEDLSTITWGLNYLANISKLGDEIMVNNGEDPGGDIYHIEGDEYIVENEGWYSLSKPASLEEDIYVNHPVEIVKSVNSKELLSLVIDELKGYKNLIQLPITSYQVLGETSTYITIKLLSNNFPNGFLDLKLLKASSVTSGVMSKEDKIKLSSLPNSSQLIDIFNALEHSIPNDITRDSENALLVNKDGQGTITGILYIRGVDHQLAGLMAAADKIKLDEYPGYSTLNAILIGIEDKIPAQASVNNKLADKAFVNSSIATSTATFRGSYNLIDDLHLSTEATREEIAIALKGVISVADQNDYSYVVIPVDDITTELTVRVDRYKYSNSWAFEYTLNNSGFTAAQWESINSEITPFLVRKLTNLPIRKDTGDYSIVSTDGSNEATHRGAIALGKNNGAKQEYAYCFGENNISIGWDTFAVGSRNNIQRHMAMAIGRFNVARAWGGIAMGLGVETFDNQTDDNNNGEIAIGRYNTPAKDKIFTIGCGTSDSDRKNALEIDLNGKVSFPQNNTSVEAIIQKLAKLVDLTKTIYISDSKIPPAYKGSFSADKFTYTQRGVVLSFPNTSVFKLDQANTNYGKVLVATLNQEITQTTTSILTITAPEGYNIKSLSLAMRTFSDSYPIGVSLDTAFTQVYATSETPLYKYFQTPQHSCTLAIQGTDTTGISAYKWLCFTMFNVELSLTD